MSPPFISNQSVYTRTNYLHEREGHMTTIQKLDNPYISIGVDDNNNNNIKSTSMKIDLNQLDARVSLKKAEISKEQKKKAIEARLIYAEVAKKYISLLENDLLEEKVATMLARNLEWTVLICETYESKDRFIDREVLVTSPLSSLLPNEEDRRRFPFVDNWNKCVIEILKEKLPQDLFLLQYHVNYIADTVDAINYEISIYSKASICNLPWISWCFCWRTTAIYSRDAQFLSQYT